MHNVEALNVLSQVVEQHFRGLPAEQRAVQQALQVLMKAIEPVPVVEDEKEEPTEDS